jgi:hypothetical protein
MPTGIALQELQADTTFTLLDPRVDVDFPDTRNMSFLAQSQNRQRALELFEKMSVIHISTDFYA